MLNFTTEIRIPLKITVDPFYLTVQMPYWNGKIRNLHQGRMRAQDHLRGTDLDSGPARGDGWVVPAILPPGGARYRVRPGALEQLRAGTPFVYIFFVITSLLKINI